MASSADDERVFSMSELRRALLSCPVCHESAGTGQPLRLKVLDCHHKVCIGCLNQLTNGQLVFSCPVCRHPMTVPAEGVDRIQNDFIAEQIQNFADSCKPKTQPQARAVSQTIRCGNCKNEIEQVLHRCVSCGYLCDECTWKHHDGKALQHHIIFTPSRSSEDASVNFRFCATHDLCRLDYFCETCRIAVCKLCKEYEHGGPCHSVRNVSELAQNSRAEMDGFLEALNNRKSLVHEVIQKVRQEEERVMVESSNKKKEIKTFIQECHGILEKREMELIGCLDHRSMQFSKCLLYTREKAEDLLAKIHNSLECVDKIKRKQDPLSVIRAVRALKPALCEIMDTRPDISTVHGDDFSSITAGDLPFDVATFKHLVSLLGRTHDESSDSNANAFNFNDSRSDIMI